MNAIQTKFAGLAVAAALATTAGVFAATASPAYAAQPAAIAVSHSDLNLAAPEGARRLDDRVQQAAERLCVQHGVKPARAFLKEQACVKQTVEAAAPQVRAAIAGQANRQYAARTIAVRN